MIQAATLPCWLFGAGIAHAATPAHPAASADGQDARTLPKTEIMTPADQATPVTDGVEDIVVTANRRQERLQDVPIAVTAISGDLGQKLGISSSSSLAAGVPGLTFNTQGNTATPFIRGIGNPSGAIGQEATVSTYVDGVYIASPQAMLFTFNNIDRVEVLKGPQGTLFGRNATGGVINIITRKPSFTPKLEAEVGYGSYDTLSGSAYASTGLSETLAFDVAAVASHQRDGWGTNLATGGEVFRDRNVAVRSKLLWEPSTRTSVTLMGDYSFSRTEIGLNTHQAEGTVGLGGIVYEGHYNIRNVPNTYSRVRQGGVSAHIEQDLDWARIVSISAYRDVKGVYTVDQDASAPVIVDATLRSRETSFTQELQLLSASDSSIQWLLGGYYLRGSAAYTPLTLKGLAFGGAVIDIAGKQTTDSYAGFGQATAALLESTKLTLGLRYTSDSREVEGSTTASGFLVGSATQKARFNKLTWRVALDHRFSEEAMVYASFNRGFKSGTFNVISYASPPVRPEVLDAYEVGLKTDLLGRRLRFNASMFYYDYQNIQVDSIVNGGTILLNAASARVKGADFEVTAVPIDGLTLGAGGSYIDGKYKSFPDAPYYNSLPGGGNELASTPGSCPAGSPFTGNGCDASGNRTVQTPEFTFNVSAAYEVKRDSGTYDANINLYHNSGFKWSVDNRLTEPSYQLLNGSIGWRSPDDRFSVRVWAANLLNTQYHVLVVHELPGDHASPAAPRTYGVKLGFKFGQ
jgi:iron complex outermembrane receptor protein